MWHHIFPIDRCVLFLSLCSYPGCVQSISDLVHGLPQSAPLHVHGRDFYIFCALFGDPVINWYLRDINVLWPSYFDCIVYLFILVFYYFILCHWCLCAWLSVFWDNWFLFILPLSVLEQFVLVFINVRVDRVCDLAWYLARDIPGPLPFPFTRMIFRCLRVRWGN